MSGNPLTGVFLNSRNSNEYAQTDYNGKFELKSVAAGDSIRVSMIGMKVYDFVADSRNNYEIVLEEDVVQLENVIVTGYQTLSRERATGSFSKIREDKISGRVVTNLNQIFSGTTTGIEVKSNGALVIRGKASIYGDSNPLVVVDGFPIDGQFSSINPNDVLSVDILKDASAASIYGSRAANGVIVVTTKKAKSDNKLNVDINSFVRIGEKIDLSYALDFASSKSHVEFDENYFEFWKNKLGLPENSDRQVRYTLSESISNLFELKRGAITQQEYDRRRAELINIDFKDQYNEYLLRNSLLQQHNIRISGAGEKNAYRVSLLYENDKTEYKYNNNDKFIVNIGNTYMFSKKLSYSVNLNARLENGENNGTTTTEMLRYTSPFTQLLDEQGNYMPMTGPGVIYLPYTSKFEGKMPYRMNFNILEEVRERKITNSTFDFRLQNKVDWQLFDFLKLSAQFQYERRNYLNNQLYNENTFYTRNFLNVLSKLDPVTGKYVSYFPKGSIALDQSGLFQAYNSRAQIDFNKTINEKHNITALAGTEVMSGSNLKYRNGFRFGLNERSLVAPPFNYTPVSSAYTYFDTGYSTYGYETSYSYPGLTSDYNYKSSSNFSESLLTDRYFSAYFNAAYNYDDRYTASVSLRTDASNFVSEDVRSKFSPFWSVGMSWNAKKENYLRDVDWLDHLLVRASYGVSGLAAGRTTTSTLTTISSVSPSVAMDYQPMNRISSRGNPSLTWEKSRTFNAAVDFSVLNNLLYGSVDFYQKFTYDILSPVQSSYVNQGTVSIIMNGGEIRNRGVEFSLNSNVKFENKIEWQNELNLSFNSNKILRYESEQNQLQAFTGYMGQAYQEGKSMDAVYAFKLGYSPEGFVSVIKKDGSALTVDKPANNPVGLTPFLLKPGESVDDNEYLYYQGQLTPKALFGYATTLKYGNFTFMALFSGKFGHIFKRNDDTEIRNIYKLNYRKSLETGWQPGDPVEPFKGRPWINETTAPMYTNGSFLYAWYYNLISQSSYMTEKADFLKFEEFYVSYDIPFSVGNQKFLGNIYSQIKNIGMIWTANKKGIDPDYIIGLGPKPQRLFTFGIKLNF